MYTRLSDMEPGRVRALLAELEAEATKFVRNCDATAPISAEYKVYMRYSGQGWEIPVALSGTDAETPSAERFQELFEADYTQLFGRPVAGLDIEITVWSVNAYTATPSVEPVADPPARTARSGTEERALFDPEVDCCCALDFSGRVSRTRDWLESNSVESF